MARTVCGIFGFFCLSVLSATAGVKGSSGVDAVTAATVNKALKFVLPPAQLGTTTATITWTFEHTDGSAVFTYNGKAVTLTTAQRTGQSISLTGLTPGTTYTIDLLCTKLDETSAEATGSFTTLTGSAINPRVMPNPHAAAASCFGNNVVSVTLFSCNGSKILSLDVPANNTERFSFLNVRTGVYFITVRTQAGTTAKKVLLTADKNYQLTYLHGEGQWFDFLPLQ